MPDNSDKKNTPDITIDILLNYFMTLYKVSLGAARNTPSAITPVASNTNNPRLITYELLVKKNDSRLTRRLTLGPIAEEAGGKSQCFFAIFDSKMIIKIPPKPVTDFSKYIQCIKRDRRIVKSLHPRTCLIPGVGVVLDKVYKFPKNNELKEEKRENIYFEWLQYNPEYQRFLMIEGRFAFFMDLSQYMFLSETFPLFHSHETMMAEEITRDPSILDNFEKFEGRYGIENIPVGVALKDVYSKYDRRTRKLIMQNTVTSSDALYKTQQWFFNFLAGKPLEKKNRSPLSETFTEELKHLLEEIVTENREAIDNYREMVKDYLRRTTFSRNKHYQSGIIANVLEMLFFLQKKGVVIRDIKPDNLLVAGDPDNYPRFLATPEHFSIGLIDFETAVIFRTTDNAGIEQPLLGGTSFFATPLNMLTNDVLSAVYKDLPRALYLQDWFAVVAMMHLIVTGEYLFVECARQFTALPRTLKNFKKKQLPTAVVVQKINRAFWKQAIPEFKRKTEKYRKQLEALAPPLYRPVSNMLVAELAAENQRTDNRIKRLINRQTIFQSRSNREKIYTISAENLVSLISRIPDNKETDPSSLTCLKTIGDLKKNLADNNALIHRLDRNTAGVSALELMEILFYRVANFMDISRRVDG